MSNIKAELLEKGFGYLDANGCCEKVVIIGLAALATKEDIGKGFKQAHIKSHKLHLVKGDYESASAALHLATWVNVGMQKQEPTFERRKELVHGIVLNRRRNIQRSLN